MAKKKNLMTSSLPRSIIYLKVTFESTNALFNLGGCMDFGHIKKPLGDLHKCPYMIIHHGLQAHVKRIGFQKFGAIVGMEGPSHQFSSLKAQGETHPTSFCYSLDSLFLQPRCLLVGKLG